MKKLLIITFLLFCSSNVLAQSISLNPVFYTINSENIENDTGILMEYGNSWKLILSYEEMLLRFQGQEACDIRLMGLGLARQFEFKDLIFEFGGGYYQPNITRRPAFREAMWLEINSRYTPHTWDTPDTYDYVLKGKIGGFFRLSYEYHFLNFGCGYRFLRLNDTLFRKHSTPGSWVEFKGTQDLSGFYLIIGIRVEF